MSSIINALLVVGGLLGVVIVFQNRCSWLQLCGDSLFPSASATPATTTTPTTTTNNYYNEDGTVNGQAVSPDMTSSRGCCECKMMGDRVKCQKNGDGNWFNPPAGPDGSNDQSIDLSLLECYKTCGSSSSSSSSSKSSMPSNGSKESSKQNKPSTGNLGDKGTTYAKGGSSGSVVKPKAGTGAADYFNANPKGYKPGGGTYFAHAYYNTIKRIQDNSCSYLTLNGKRLSI